ncbi:MAG TPA: GEVED domain-containing protein, partial [Flavobacteriales bacterium]|nr:GEVED domain-containing protein [Flavobacteriales bacterium]
MKVKDALKALTHLCAVVALLLGAHWRASAQTTITTSTLGSFAVPGITFVVENTNPYPVQITTVGLHVQATSNGGTATLYASTTSLSGTTTIPSAAWTTVASTTIVSAGTAVLPIFNGLTYTIPATSAVRFGITTTTNLIIGNPGVNTYSSAGVNLRRGNYVIGGFNVGFAAATLPNFTFNPYDYNGLITFIPIVPCAGVPAPGATTSNVLGACIGQNITLGLQNSTSGTGVTYAWEFDNGGGWTSFGTSAATQTVTQSASTSYRCTVTCTEPGGGSQTSTPITIGMAGSLPVEFTQTFFPSNCWVRSGTAAAFVARDNANGFGLPGTGSAKWDFWNAGAGTTQIITSPDFAPLTGTNQVVFDVAGAKWTDAAIDQITLEYSSSGSGGPWTSLAVMNNALGGELNTGGEVATAFTPSAAQWVQRTYAIPAGATNIRFVGLAGFGNNVFIDNIDIEAILTCATPTGVAANLLTPSSAEATWTLNGADSYDIELRTSGAPGSGPAGLADGGSALVPPFSLTVVLGQTYFLYVRANCGVDGFSAWSAPASLTVDYCATTAIVGVNDPVISQFTFAGINNTNASNAGYLDFTAQTAFVVPGVPTALFLDRTTDFALDSLFIWMDLNNDLDFDDAGELVYTSPALFPDPLNAFITIPNGTSPGNKRMRVRRVNMTGGFGWTSPCGTAPFGQTHDYTVNVCGFPEATAAVIDDCGNNEFSVAVDITSNPGGALTINWVATPGGPGSMPASLGVNNLPAFPTNASVSITVSNGTLCELDLGDHFSNCPITVNCG